MFTFPNRAFFRTAIMNLKYFQCSFKSYCQQSLWKTWIRISWLPNSCFFATFTWKLKTRKDWSANTATSKFKNQYLMTLNKCENCIAKCIKLLCTTKCYAEFWIFNELVIPLGIPSILLLPLNNHPVHNRFKDLDPNLLKMLLKKILIYQIKQYAHKNSLSKK